MLGQWDPRFFVVWTLVLLSATASAQTTVGTTEVSLPFADEKRAGSALSEEGPTLEGNSAPMDYATFVLELLAFVAKEVLPDSQDEFSESLIGSRLSHSMPEQRSEFGSHCLTVVSRLGSAVPYPSTSGAAPARSAAAPALQTMWSAFENGTRGGHKDVSLNVKVGVNKVGMGLTFRW